MRANPGADAPRLRLGGVGLILATHELIVAGALI